jgi:hypothetical protein
LPLHLHRESAEFASFIVEKKKEKFNSVGYCDFLSLDTADPIPRQKSIA